MPKKKVYMTRPYHPEAREALEEHFDVEVCDSHRGPSTQDLLEIIPNFDGVFAEGVDIIGEEIFSAASRLKVVANRGVGTDNLDIPAATRHGVFLSNTPGILQESCADMTFALILAAARRIAYSDRAIREGKWEYWDQTPYLGTDVYGKTLGIVGLGGIGQRVAKRASGFEMRVVYFSRTRKLNLEKEMALEWAPNLDSLLAQSDYLSLHMPLTPDTQGLIGERELRLMKPEAFLINTSRGRTVNSSALYKALHNHWISGAALDVTDPEPLLMDDSLLSLPNLVITPHIASSSTETFRAMARMAIHNITAALTGGPMPSCINPDAIQNQTGSDR